jgi:hypothetical protein
MVLGRRNNEITSPHGTNALLISISGNIFILDQTSSRFTLIGVFANVNFIISRIGMDVGCGGCDFDGGG